MRMPKHNYVRLRMAEAFLQRIIKRVGINDVMDQKLALGQFDNLGEPVAKPRVVGVP